jgi:hypothetical protein
MSEFGVLRGRLSGPAAEPPTRSWYILLALTTVAVVVGTIARFKGLGIAPYAVDEYYIGRSVEFILAHGLPQYDCGGYYTRGIILQYLTAGLRLLGLGPELAPRFVAAVCGLIALPAAYLIGRRVVGRSGALVIVIILSLSVWEVGMARFARMYAPFQALFLWHMVFLLRYTVDRDIRALTPMLVCTLLGPFTWEGGVFLALANFIPPLLHHRDGQLRREDWIYVVVATVLLAFSYWFATVNLRIIIPDAWPAGYSPSMIESPAGALDQFEDAGPTMSLPWIAAGLLAFVVIVIAARWIWSFRPRWLTVLGLFTALLAAALHQFILTAAALLLLPLLRLVDWREYAQRAAMPYHAAIVLFAAGWVTYGAVTFDWQAQSSVVRGLALMLYPYVQLPDVVMEVARPWGQAVPVLGIVLLLTLGAATIRMIRSAEPVTAERVLLVTVICMTLAASASNPPRHETRYVFFLYALIVTLAVTMAARLSDRLCIRIPAATAWLAPIMALAVFAATEDFQPLYLMRIDTPAAIFGQGMSPEFAEHLVSREDSRAIASWMKERKKPGDIVVNSYQSFDHYYADIDFFYMDWRDARFPGWSCNAGAVERWRNLPLLYTDEALESAIRSGQRTYVINWTDHLERMLPRVAHLKPRIVMTNGSVSIAMFDSTQEN